ncbi:hypothetical protein [Sandaracinus amylolyticus]|uniref:hypothetical protein n=1 Tax=Sandaracinus amylolyticus TaxID=927083 RepID=UPI001F44199E|nr:hypothetical protein [Sandaracinus amylolyticus]UJR79539.1 Hypothetical protein I5071_15750 [Sandaracinus amylolyticus]
MTRASGVSAVLFAFAFVFALGCDCGGDPPGGRGCDTNRDCRTGEMCIDSRCTRGQDGALPGLDAMPIDAPTSRVVSVRIEPATAMLESVDGSRPTVDFMAVSVFDDGMERPSNGPSFTIDNVSLGDLDEASGEYIANGVIGGAATVTLSVPGPGGTVLTATASLTVRVRRTLRGDAITDDDVTRIDGLTPTVDPARSAVVYPLDGVVMPQNVYPADVQWNTSAAGDLFRVTITKPSATVVAYLVHDPAMHWLVDAGAWRTLAQTDPDAQAELVVDRLEASSGQLVRSATIHVTFARAALTGSVYYWEIASLPGGGETGRILRIDDGAGTAVNFMPSPPVAPNDGARCVGCHTVSNSGRYMAGRLGGGENMGAIFDLTTDLTGTNPSTVWPVTGSSLTWWFSSWSPDDTRLAVAYWDDNASQRRIRIYDPFAGTEVTVTGTLPVGTHPAWSPDGRSIAYVAGTDSWGGNFTRGDIAILSVTAPDTVGTSMTIHTAASIAGSTADSYPTWSPDSQHIAFANGSGARSERDLSSLYLMRGDGAEVTHLARASSTGRLDYQPRFSPFVSGEPPQYYWMSFLSRRDYGNAPRGNVTRPLTRRQQIWVTAIRIGAPAGEDPSAVPYWLPGQSPLSANISAFWAPRPCREDGEGCSVGSECCGGDCRPPAGGGAPVCSPPPPENCRESGETCSTTADCCPDMGLTCINRVCVAGPG